MNRRLAVALSLAASFALASCAAPADQATSPTTGAGTASAENCTPEGMKTFTAGSLTVATDDPAYEPWFSDNDPSNGKGYESAVAYAVAEKLGFAKDKVVWKRVPFNAVVNPGEHPFDFDVNQVSITEERRKAVDFSSGYYDVVQTIVTIEDSKISAAKSLADLKGAKLGAQVGTTSYKAITDQIKPTAQPAVYDTNDAAVQALKNSQIDGIVVDMPTAFYMTGAQLDGGVILGQIEPVGEVEQFGAVLPKGSPITGCISKAIDDLKADGTLTKLQDEFLGNDAARVLTSDGAAATPAAATTN